MALPNERVQIETTNGTNGKKGTQNQGKANAKEKGDGSTNRQDASSRTAKESRLQWLLGEGITIEDFLATNWEKQPLYIQRNGKNFYGDLFNKAKLLELAKTTDLQFGDVTIAKHEQQNEASSNDDWHGELPAAQSVPSLSLANRIQQMSKLSSKDRHPTGRATSRRLKELFDTGHTAQLFAVQKRSSEVLQLARSLEADFNSLVGATAYLTPPNSQGIAPHHDDVEVFILQTEGSKRWQLYRPVRVLAHKYEKVPPTSLPDPIMEVTVHQGDLLYLPRGFIHQAQATDEFSTHLTVSTFQGHSIGELLEGMLAPAVIKAMNADNAFRQGLPFHAFNRLGSAAQYTESDATLRDEVARQVSALLPKLAAHIDIAEGIDRMSYEFMKRRLPYEAEQEAVLETDEAQLVGGYYRLQHPLHTSMHILPSEELEDEDEDEDEEEEEDDDDSEEEEEAEEEEEEDDEQQEGDGMDNGNVTDAQAGASGERELVVVTTRRNAVTDHLLPAEECAAPHRVSLPMAFAPAVAAMLASPAKKHSIGSIPLPPHQSKLLLSALVKEGVLVRCQPPLKSTPEAAKSTSAPAKSSPGDGRKLKKKKRKVNAADGKY